MPFFLSLGVSKKEFFESTPKELEVYIDAEKMAQRRRDSENWQMGMYNMSAFSVALGRALSGRKSKAKYMDKPLSEQIAEKAKEEDENLTEEQKEVERDKLLTALMTWQANFELNHSGVDN